jgi:hypothetical protein
VVAWIFFLQVKFKPSFMQLPLFIAKLKDDSFEKRALEAQFYYENFRDGANAGTRFSRVYSLSLSLSLSVSLFIM